jgi:peptidoglycan/xylan/chitin deacetylase (PgdA/CDA1 family)
MGTRGIITYHSIDDSGSVISITPACFQRHVEWIVRAGVSVRSLDAILERKPKDDQHALAITFDDGYLNVAERAAPLLREHGLPATVFVVSGRAGRDNGWERARGSHIPMLPLLDWDALGRLSESGVQVGAHSRTHPHLTRLPDSAIEDELAGCAEEIERRIGTRPVALAYPYGNTDARVAGIARRVFNVGVTTRFRTLDGPVDPLLVPRLDAWYFREPGSLESWGSTSFHLRVLARDTVRRVRRLVRPD